MFLLYKAQNNLINGSGCTSSSYMQYNSQSQSLTYVFSAVPRMHGRCQFFHKVKGRIFKQFNSLFNHVCIIIVSLNVAGKILKTKKILAYHYKRRAWNGRKVSSLGVSDRNWGRFVGEHLAASFLSQFMPKAIKPRFCTVHDTF